MKDFANIVFVDERNRDFVEGNSAEPFTKQDILANLRLNRELLFVSIPQPGGKDAFYTLGCGIFVIVGGIALFIKVLLNFVIAPSNTLLFEEIPLIMLALTSLIAPLLMIGHPSLLAWYYGAKRVRFYEKHLYASMVQDKKLAVGEITAIRGGHSSWIINYSFTLQNNEDIQKGQYQLHTNPSFSIGDKIVILCLTKKIHVLL